MLRWVRDVGRCPRSTAGSRPRPWRCRDANTVADVTSCPGAESCRLAVTQSRGLGRLLGDHLRARPDLVAAAEDLQIKISGCPNGCGQHHIAGLGFQGSVRRLGARVVPQYFVMVGGGVDDEGATLRPPRGQDSGAARAGGGRAADRRSTGAERAAGRDRRPRSSGASSSRA